MIEKRASRQDWELAGEGEEMLVAGNEDGAFLLCKREEVVVTGVARSPWRIRWVGGDERALAQDCDERLRFLVGYAAPQLRIGECSLQLSEQSSRDHDFEVAGEPAGDDLSRRAPAREQRRDENVRIEDGSHSAPAPACLVLSLHREFERLLLAEILALPQPLEEIESEVSTERLFDHLAVTLASTRSTHLDCTHDFFVHCQGRSNSRHNRIIASRREDASSRVNPGYVLRSTAKTHVARVLQKLGIRDRLLRKGLFKLSRLDACRKQLPGAYARGSTRSSAARGCLTALVQAASRFSESGLGTGR